MNRSCYLLLGSALAFGSAACTRDPTTPNPAEAVAPTGAASTEYGKRLLALKSEYPFRQWTESGLARYTRRVANKFSAIFDTLISDLVAAGENATEAQKLASFERASTALNRLHHSDLSLIETGERDALCELGNRIAAAAGLDPKRYGHGEGPLSAGRDW